MSREWTLRLVSELRESVQRGAKTDELRIETAKNKWLIQQMLRYQIGDSLHLEFARRGVVESDSITTKITEVTSVKKFGELGDVELKKVIGLLSLSREKLKRVLESLYNQKIDEQTRVYLAHFA